MESYESQFLISLCLTITIELIILFFLLKIFFKNSKILNSEIIFAGILASFTTLPYLWFIFPYFIHDRTFFILIGELSVVLVESVIYYFILKLKYYNCFILSFICNLISFLAGLLIRV